MKEQRKARQERRAICKAACGCEGYDDKCRDIPLTFDMPHLDESSKGSPRTAQKLTSCWTPTATANASRRS